MCGIVGYVAEKNAYRLGAAVKSLAHRGPDATGTAFCDIGDSREVALGHTRLSIIALEEAANQPFNSQRGRYTIVFNGEIYNYLELRRELNNLGVSFTTASDTEVLLQAYIHWGKKCLPKLDGMFAFVIYDRETRTLFCARDLFGIKPFFFRWNPKERSFLFASEIQTLKKLCDEPMEPDTDCFAEFLLNGWLYEPQTGIKHISKLAPGQYASFHSQTGQMDFGHFDDPLAGSPNESLDELLAEAVNLQACADVPVGLFFSGGLDSTVVASSCSASLTGLFLDYSNDPSDIGLDRQYASKIAKALNFPMITEIDTGSNDNVNQTLDSFRSVAQATGEPISDYTYKATNHLSVLARENGFKVMLSGMGGDELFAGYPRMQLARYYNTLRHLGPLSTLFSQGFSKFPSFSKRADRLGGFLGADEFADAYTSLIGYFSFREIDQLLGTSNHDQYTTSMIAKLEPVKNRSPLKQAMYLDRMGFLPHNLTITDRASMATGLEIRVPLLTAKLAAWAFNQPERNLISLNETKKPLRQLAELRLDKSLINRPKQGFNPPLDSKINQIGPDRMIDEMEQSGLFHHVDRDIVNGMIRNHFDHGANETYRLWQLMYLGYWIDSLSSNL